MVLFIQPTLLTYLPIGDKNHSGPYTVTILNKISKGVINDKTKK